MTKLSTPVTGLHRVNDTWVVGPEPVHIPIPDAASRQPTDGGFYTASVAWRALGRAPQHFRILVREGHLPPRRSTINYKRLTILSTGEIKHDLRSPTIEAFPLDLLQDHYQIYVPNIPFDWHAFKPQHILRMLETTRLITINGAFGNRPSIHQLLVDAETGRVIPSTTRKETP